MLRLWNRLTQLPDFRLTKRVFLWDCANNYPWAAEMSAIFTNLEQNFIFFNKLKCDLELSKQNLLMIYKTQWKCDVLKKPKLRKYVIFKKVYDTEIYVRLNLSRKQRSLCAQWRTGTLPLAVEVGRFKGIPEENRICTMCDLGLVEHEFHFVLYCPFYTDLRSILFERVQCLNPDVFWMSEGEMLSWIFSNEVFAFVNFICKAWERRQNVMYRV